MTITLRKIMAASATLFLCGCTSTIDTSDQTLSSNVPNDYGTAIGSILLSIPTNINGAHEQKVLQALASKKYEALIGRFIHHEYGFASRTEHPGDKYRVTFAAGDAKHFVVRAPAGRYSFQKISQVLTGIFGTYEGCRIQGLANFDIHPGKTTYIGQLSIVPEFKKDQRWFEAKKNFGLIPHNIPETVLGMRGSVIDNKAESLRAIAQGEISQNAEVDTSLMFVDKRDKWDCVPPPPPPPPPGTQR